MLRTQLPAILIPFGDHHDRVGGSRLRFEVIEPLRDTFDAGPSGELDEDDPQVWLMACVEQTPELLGVMLMMLIALPHLRDNTLRGHEVAVQLR